MNGYTQIAKEILGFSEILENYKKNISPVRVTMTAESQKVHLAFSLCDELGKNIIYVAPDSFSASFAADDFAFFLKEKPAVYTEREISFWGVEASSNLDEKTRMGVLKELVYKKGRKTVITTIEALSQKIPSRDSFIKNTILFRPGLVYQMQSIIDKLVKIGYVREEIAEAKGQFAVRGGIVDVFPYAEDTPYRIEFFDEEIETIRKYDLTSQRSYEKAEEITVSPVSEDFAPKDSLLSDYLDDCILFLDEPHRIVSAYEEYVKNLADSIVLAKEKGIKLSKAKKDVSYFAEGYEKTIASFGFTVGFSNLSISAKGLYPNAVVSVPAKPMPAYNGDFDLLCDDVKYYLIKGYRIIMPCGDIRCAERIKEKFANYDIKAEIKFPFDEKAELGEVTLVEGVLKYGFEYPEILTAFISDREISSRPKAEKKPIKTKNAIRNISEIKEGDFVVHRKCGIGIYKGINRLTIDGVKKDYLKIKYQGSDVLYVPVNQLDLISKYVGGSDNVKINKMGGSKWSETKSKVIKSLEVMAKDLVELYAKRSKEKGFAFLPDCDLQTDFERTFPYNETDDQLKAIKCVKEDMENTRPMDRLVCGDVGYGKTEVAMRAAFKAVMSSKQVAYLVPTTLLAQQQFDSFSQRMKDFPVNIKLMSRFRNKKQQAQTVEELKAGKCDIVIGTHRILQQDIKFKDLGLLIIDEEQRFGVRHKEKIKSLKSNVDVLTLSATPIPRTLNMAMNGLRDMSTLNDPPDNRKPVQTYVMEYKGEVIKTAICKEIARGGQVYYLHNNVESLYSAADKIKKLVPEARIAVGHGKMSETQLEDIMADIIKGEYDVLVCTTIIETGLDIPNMNTIIIEDADKFGLSQLYQLRGRVGRSSRLAYAYLTVKRNKVIDEVAEKRLKAIKEFTQFGAGIKIAMRDLEIRGAGALLGTKQHGHINSVGYELYCKLLDEAVEKIKNNRSLDEEDIVVSVDINTDAYIPETYIEDSVVRIDVYKAIASVANEKDAEDIRNEIRDRFGEIPKSIENLIKTVIMKNKAQALSVSDITQRGDMILFNLTKNSPMQKFVDYVSKRRVEFYFSNLKDKVLLVYKPKKFNKNTVLDEICDILDGISRE